MFTLVKALQYKAVDAYFNHYRKMFTSIHPVEILDYSTEMNFVQNAEEINKIEKYYGERQKQELGTVKNLMAYVAFGLGAACGVAAFFVHLLLLAGLGVGLAIGAGILISNKFKKNNIILKIQKQKTSVLDIVKKLFAEHTQMIGFYKENDAISVKITEEFAKF